MIAFAAHSRIRSIARVAFPVALLLFAGLFFGGQLGWWSDDHWHNLRDPVTDEIRGLILHRGFFLRPLFYSLVPALTTSLWHHDGQAHAIQIVSHGLAVVLLWRLLRMLGIGDRAAGAAALLFMLYPGQFEALYWFAALPTSMSSAAMLVVMMLAVGVARGRFGVWAVGAMAGLTFVSCCLNEQPASVAGVLPLLAWSARRSNDASPRRLEDTRGGARRTWARTLAPAAVCVLSGALYLAIVMLDPRAPKDARGQVASLVPLDRVWERTGHFADLLWRRVLLKNWASGALREGWAQVRERGAWAWLALAGLMALGVAWAWAGSDRAGDARAEVPATANRTGRRLDLVALGLAVCLVGWLPIWVVWSYAPDSRCRYWPGIGLAMIIAAAIDRAARSQALRARGRIVAARLGLGGLLVLCALMLVGAQTGLRNRWRMDVAEGEALRRLVPDPAPYTMFVPVFLRQQALASGAPVLDTHFRSVWEFPWTVPVFIERVYRREDVRCGYWRRWMPTDPVVGGDRDGLHYNDALGPRFPALPDGTHLIPWDRAVVFTVGEDRVLRVATRVILERAGEADVVIEVPQAGECPEFVVRLPRL
jgi:hypothetical protein